MTLLGISPVGTWLGVSCNLITCWSMNLDSSGMAVYGYMGHSAIPFMAAAWALFSSLLLLWLLANADDIHRCGNLKEPKGPTLLFSSALAWMTWVSVQRAHRMVNCVARYLTGDVEMTIPGQWIKRLMCWLCIFRNDVYFIFVPINNTWIGMLTASDVFLFAGPLSRISPFPLASSSSFISAILLVPLPSLLRCAAE